jgi:peptidoglycan hydrolase CwlO-like protein
MRRPNSILLSVSFALVISSLCYSPTFAKDESKDMANEMTTSLKDPAKIEQLKAQQEKTDNKMIDSVNQIPGVEVDKEAFKEKKGFTIGDLNPFKWIFKPIVSIGEKVVHLEKQIVRLEAPIASLHKPLVDVRVDMQRVQGQIGGVSGDMSSVERRLGHIEEQLDKMYPPIADLKQPIQELSEPITGLQEQLNWILAATYAVGFLVCFGTPVAALFAYTYRYEIMKKLGGAEGAKQLEEATSKNPHQVRQRRNIPAT